MTKKPTNKSDDNSKGSGKENRSSTTADFAESINTTKAFSFHNMNRALEAGGKKKDDGGK